MASLAFVAFVSKFAAEAVLGLVADLCVAEMDGESFFWRFGSCGALLRNFRKMPNALARAGPVRHAFLFEYAAKKLR